MTTAEQLLWDKILLFQLDNPQASFTFSARLAKENGWTKRYTSRVIEEYKKFIFLCCIAETGVTPSDPVDQVWHLHLTYTKSYWIDLCKNTLGKEIHHNPTIGGKTEANKFDTIYTSSKDLYISRFGTEPPPDIWQPNDTRFNDIDFQRVNLSSYWLIKKPGKHFKAQLIIAGVVLAGLLSIRANNPATLIIIMMIIIVVLSLISKAVRGSNSSGNIDNRKKKDDDPSYNATNPVHNAAVYPFLIDGSHNDGNQGHQQYQNDLPDNNHHNHDNQGSHNHNTDSSSGNSGCSSGSSGCSSGSSGCSSGSSGCSSGSSGCGSSS